MKNTETAIALRPGEDVEAHTYFAEGVALLESAEARVIKTPEDVKLVNDDLSAIAKLKKVMEGKQKELLDPLKAQADEIRNTYTYLMTPIFQANSIYREKMLAYVAEETRKRLEQEAINREKQELAEREATLSGKEAEPVELVEVSPEVAKRTTTDMGSTGQRMIKKWELVDKAQVPEEYKVLDSATITKVVKAGIPSIPGIRIYEEPIITVNAR